jgi:UDP-2-acetamido-3-amino-2,3-dideoxy-glucuronate N-acetyltransferase
MVGHLLLYHPAFRALARLFGSGALGELRYVYANRASLGRIRREENALWSFAPHDISMILALAGRMPTSVACSGGNYLAQGVADTTLSHLDFGGDLQAHIFVSWLHPYKDHRLVVIGSEAMAVFDDVAAGPEKLCLFRHKAGWQGEVPVINKAEAEPVPYEDAEPLRLECEAFLEAISSGTRPPSDADEGIRVLRVLDACQRALSSGERVKLGA